MFCKGKKEKFSPNEENAPEKVKRLTGLLKLRSEHEQALAKTGWDSYQRDLVGTLYRRYTQFPVKINILSPLQQNFVGHYFTHVSVSNCLY